MYFSIPQVKNKLVWSCVYSWACLHDSEQEKCRLHRMLPGVVFTEAKSGINDPGLFQRRQFRTEFRFVWIKWSRRRNLLSHWLLWRAGLWFQPIVSDFLYCRKLFMNSTNFQQKTWITWSWPFHLDHFLTVNTASEDWNLSGIRPEAGDPCSQKLLNIVHTRIW